MDEDAFPALIAETYLLPGGSSPVAQDVYDAGEESVHGALQHLLPRFALELRAAFRSFAHPH
jgi:hypothetical protein